MRSAASVLLPLLCGCATGPTSTPGTVASPGRLADVREQTPRCPPAPAASADATTTGPATWVLPDWLPTMPPQMAGRVVGVVLREQSPWGRALVGGDLRPTAGEPGALHGFFDGWVSPLHFVPPSGALPRAEPTDAPPELSGSAHLVRLQIQASSHLDATVREIEILDGSEGHPDVAAALTESRCGFARFLAAQHGPANAMLEQAVQAAAPLGREQLQVLGEPPPYSAGDDAIEEGLYPAWDEASRTLRVLLVRRTTRTQSRELRARISNCCTPSYEGVTRQSRAAAVQLACEAVFDGSGTMQSRACFGPSLVGATPEARACAVLARQADTARAAIARANQGGGPCLVIENGRECRTFTAVSRRGHPGAAEPVTPAEPEPPGEAPPWCPARLCDTERIPIGAARGADGTCQLQFAVEAAPPRPTGTTTPPASPVTSR